MGLEDAMNEKIQEVEAILHGGDYRDDRDRDTDGDGKLDSDELRDIADDLEDEEEELRYAAGRPWEHN